MRCKAKPTTDSTSVYSLPHAPGITCVGITGGIGSGKSYVCAQLEAAGHHVFYCDDEAKRIIRTDLDVRRQLKKIVCPDVYDAEGRLVKSVLAAYLCRGRKYAAQVDAVVHPRVAQAFTARAEALAAACTPKPEFTLPSFPQGQTTLEFLQQMPAGQTLFMECALLFESRFNLLVHHTVLVHVSAETQISRLMARDGICRSKAMEWISLQLDENEKLSLADTYIINE